MDVRPARLAAAAIALALLAGGLGYQWGKTRGKAAATPGSGQATARGTTPARPARDHLAAPDVKGLRARLDAEPSALARLKLATQSLEAWMKTDPAGALDWLQKQEPSYRRNEIIRLALGQFAESDPQAAASWTLDHLQGIEQQNTLLRIAEQWGTRDGLQAARWFSALPAGRLRDAGLEGILFCWSAEDPSAALAFLDGQPAAGENAAVMRQAAFAGWAKSDPAAAAGASLESSRRHGDPATFANTLANWATLDPQASATWLDRQVPAGSPERSAATAELAGIFADLSPEEGLQWIASLAQAEQSPALHHFAAAWAESDPAAAAGWLARGTPAGLDPALQDAILRGFLAEDPAAFDQWRNTLAEGPLKQLAGTLGATPDEDGAAAPQDPP